MNDAPRLIFEEIVAECPGAVGVFTIQRSKIRGGWLVTMGDGGVCFVSDPSHEWDGASL